MPPGIEDRNADVWESLLAVADAAGGDWPRLAREAAVALIKSAQEREPSLGIRLLTDLRTVFGEQRAMSTANILAALCALKESPWNDLKGKPLNDRGLALRLRQYEVKSKPVRIAGSDGTLHGYSRLDLHDAWERYLPGSSPAGSETSETCETSGENPNVFSDEFVSADVTSSETEPHTSETRVSQCFG